MKKSRFFQKLNNKGASLVTVIIVIGFVSILAGVVMMTSLVNYKMKRVNAYAKDTFYSAEQVLDEINIGLQRYISDSVSTAYVDVMQNYSSYSTEQKSLVLQTNYYENMWKKLEKDASAHKKYDVEVLEGFLKDTTKWQGGETDGYGAIIRAVDSAGDLSMEGDMITYESGIVLKNLRVFYKDSKGFLSIIQTDIRLTYPDLEFASTTTLPEVSSYVVIADSGMEMLGNSPMSMEGNFYADYLLSEGTNGEERRKITHSGDGDVILKHELELKNSFFTNDETGTLWADGIKLIGGTLELNGKANIADDLNASGNMSKVTLAGVYNGYGNSINNSLKSSAILVNGTNTTIDLTKIEKLTIAGHAYVGTKTLKEDGESDENAVENKQDVFTGESIAVKSNQLMYMVPPECIGVDSTNGTSLFYKNPLTSEQYNEMQELIKANPERYSEVSLDVVVEKLGGTLGEYIPVVNGKPQPEIVYVSTSNKPLVYYYMKFDNETTANRYFSTYYNQNKATYDKYINSYIDKIEFPTTASVTRIKLAANGVHTDKEAGLTMIPYTVEGASTQLSGNQVLYQEQFTALCTKLTKNYAELINLKEMPGDNNRIVFDNLIDEAMLAAYISAGGGSNTLILNGEQGRVVLTTAPSYTVTEPDVHLVISSGDVLIDVTNFKGTVFADGKVTTTAKVLGIHVDEETVNAMLRYYQEIDGKNIMVAQVLRDGKDYVFDVQGSDEDDKQTTSLADLIVYENWKKE